MSNSLDTETAVRERYAAAAQECEPQLCCPVDYDRQYLEVIPEEVIQRDYGCGDPSKYVRQGETVLDLGSGGGKICFIASQVVGPSGKVIGVDMNDTMLKLARSSQKVVAKKIGYDNVHFYKGRIQDMAIDRDAVDQYLKTNPISDESSLQKYESMVSQLRRESPMIPDNSVDVVVSNCVLNLVDASEKEKLFAEIFRVLKRGGRAVISDIVSDEFVPQAMQDDAELWSGCISGAFQEAGFLAAFERAGFYGIEMPVLQKEPWQTVQGIEFRSATVIAYKGKEGPCLEHNEAVIYRGPFARVTDDLGHSYDRGERIAVCGKTFELLTKQPYVEHFVAVPPMNEISAADAKTFDCSGGQERRAPKVTKGPGYKASILPVADDCCDTGECC
ncbi:methyltransferase domain-containing protein [Planctomycetes bacterium K23_9]|uniref:Arsenite methyltransferase n=1 Tax=Stieleria marina TaxID=1930275 RepID=A0A517NN66_9BACT|nr:arsenite S-adenosylmethyltransferase [Planctomycetes bacterium K23_9]